MRTAKDPHLSQRSAVDQYEQAKYGLSRGLAAPNFGLI